MPGGDGSPRARLPAGDGGRRLDQAHERPSGGWSDAGPARPSDQALFGIVQGGTDLGRRDASVEGICNIDLPGYAIGGVAVGEGPELIRTVVEHTASAAEGSVLVSHGVGYERTS